MRKIILLMHASLDGFVAGPNGEMNWIIYDQELRNWVSDKLKSANAVIYGRVTYDMMAAYWPTAAEAPGASPYDIEHANWVNAATKIVFSKTIKQSNWNNTRLINENIPEEMKKLKQQGSGNNDNIVMIGSAESANFLMRHDLIDEYWIDINPVILGSGKRLFQDPGQMKKLQLVHSKQLSSGVVAFDYITKR